MMELPAGVPPALRIADSTSVRNRSEVSTDPPHRSIFRGPMLDAARISKALCMPLSVIRVALVIRSTSSGVLISRSGRNIPSTGATQIPLASSCRARPSGKSAGTRGRAAPRAFRKWAMTAAWEGLLPLFFAISCSCSLRETTSSTRASRRPRSSSRSLRRMERRPRLSR